MKKIVRKLFPEHTQLFDFANKNIDYNSWALRSFKDIDFPDEENLSGKTLRNYTSKS